ncbi:MAG: hypothetical protein ACLFR2_06710 [Candidatus Kapaibacterium sp.]
MSKSLVKNIESRLEKALENNMPIESKYIFAGEFNLLNSLGFITIEELERYYKKLGFKREELFKYTDYVDFGEPEED